MMGMPRRTTPPRSTETARGDSILPAAVEAGGGISASWDAGGLTIRDARPRSLWVKITGQDGSTNRYAWTQIDEGDTAAFDTGLATDFAATGTSDADGGCAYEINGRTDVPVDGTVRVRLWPAGDLTYYTFEYALPGTSSLTVEEVDGSPSYSSITTLRFDQTDGFVVSQPSAGVARIDLTPAAIGTGTDNHCALWNGTGVQALKDSPIVVEPSLGATSGDASNLTINFYPEKHDGTFWSNPGVGIYLQMIDDATPSFSALTVREMAGLITDKFCTVYSDGIGFSAPTVGGAELTRQADVTGGGARHALTFAGSSTITAIRVKGGTTVQYEVQIGATVYPGITSVTLGPGFQVTGGIVTDPGSGSFGDAVLSANQTFTNANAFHPSADVVPVTIQGGGAGTADLLDVKNAAGTIVMKSDASGNMTANSFTGSGAGLTSIPAGQLTGTVDGGTW